MSLSPALFRFGRNLLKYRLTRSGRRSTGTVLMFNDFYRFKGDPDMGERKALTEFLAAHPEVLLTDYAKFASVGQAFIVHTTPVERFLHP